MSDNSQDSQVPGIRTTLRVYFRLSIGMIAILVSVRGVNSTYLKTKLLSIFLANSHIPISLL